MSKLIIILSALIGALIPWVIIAYYINIFKLEKEGVIILLITLPSIYCVANIKKWLLNIKKLFLLFNFFKKNINPSYCYLINQEMFFLNHFFISKIKSYLKNKSIIDKYSEFLNQYFFSLELSIQKKEQFYFLRPLAKNSINNKLFNIELSLENIILMTKEILSQEEQDFFKNNILINYKSYSETLSVHEATSIFYYLIRNQPNFKTFFQSHYYNYFKNNNIKFKLMLSLSEDLIFNDIFCLIFAIDDTQFEDSANNLFETEKFLLNVCQYQIYFHTSSNYYKNNNIEEFKYKYLPLNFQEEFIQTIKNNNFIQNISSLIELNKSIYYNKSFIMELEYFNNILKSLELTNTLKKSLINQNIKPKKNTIKI